MRPPPPTDRGRPGLLVSVRSPEEAEAALRGGADLIDVKEPAAGPLGRAPDEVIAAIVARVAGRRPVSAALGELLDHRGPVPVSELTFVKWGLAGCRANPAWRKTLRAALATLGGPQVVLVAYADGEAAGAPPLDAVFALALEQPGSVLLVDTHGKHPGPGQRRPTLLDWQPVAAVEELCRRARAAGVRVALAGSLGPEEIVLLRGARPDWFAVRGAACAGGEREARVDATRVRALVQLVGGNRLSPNGAQ